MRPESVFTSAKAPQFSARRSLCASKTRASEDWRQDPRGQVSPVRRVFRLAMVEKRADFIPGEDDTPHLVAISYDALDVSGLRDLGQAFEISLVHAEIGD